MVDRGVQHMRVKEDGHGKSCSHKRTEGRMDDVLERERVEGGGRGCYTTTDGCAAAMWRMMQMC